MLQILICDDDRKFADEIKELAGKALRKQGVEFECHLFYRGEEFLNYPACEKELIFMDIELPDMSGLEIAEHLKVNRRNKNLIFLTNHDYLVFPSLKCFPFYFMQKSKMREELYEVVEEFLKEKSKGEGIFEYCKKHEVYHVKLCDIMYLTYWEHRILLVMANGEEIQFRGKLKECEEQLSGYEFFQTNKGTFVNLKYCKTLKENSFGLIDGKNISISRERKKNAKARFMHYWRELYG